MSEVYIQGKLIPSQSKLYKLNLQIFESFFVNLHIYIQIVFQKDGRVSLTDYLTTWKGMEDAKDLNLTRSIGVSNFNISQIQRLWDSSRIKPSVLQIEVIYNIINNNYLRNTCTYPYYFMLFSVLLKTLLSTWCFLAWNHDVIL